jgi:hypothetical protein
MVTLGRIRVNIRLGWGEIRSMGKGVVGSQWQLLGEHSGKGKDSQD